MKTLKGVINVDIAYWTLNGTELKLKDLGAPVYGENHVYWNMIEKVVIQIPQNLSKEETELFTKLVLTRK